MNSKFLLCLALALDGSLLGCSTSSQHSAAVAPPEKTAGETDWQITIRAATTNAAPPWMRPFSEPLGTMNYTVPADAAKILESQPKPELLPFLAKLRMEPPPWKAGIVDEWITIVRDGLHGRPGVITGTLTTTKAVASTNEIPIYTFSEHFGRRAQNIPLDVRAALLASAKKNEPDFPDGRNLVLTHFAEVGSVHLQRRQER